MSLNHGEIRKPHRERLLALLQDLKWHPHYRLKDVAGVRYSARLLELKRLGYEIDSEEIDGIGGKKYRLVNLTPSTPQGKRVKVFLELKDAERIVERGYISPSAKAALADAIGSFKTNKDKL